MRTEEKKGDVRHAEDGWMRTEEKIGDVRHGEDAG